MKMNAKKLLALVLVLIMTFALCATAFAYSKGDVLECTGNDVKVRKGPGTSYSKIGSLDKGDKVTFISKSGSWSKVEYNGQTAYVYSKYLKAASSSSGSSSSSNTMYATTGVRVRSGPGTSYSQLGSLVEDQAVVKTGKSGSWIQIQYNGVTAYVHGKYLTTVVPDGVDESTGSSNSASNSVVAKHDTYIYRGPGQSYGVLCMAKMGEKLAATGVVSGSFTQVNTPYGIGYVQTSTVSGAVSSTASNGTILVATYLNKEPSYASPNYGIVLQVGTKVTCTGVVTGVWTQISYAGYTGYVHKDSVSTGAVNNGVNGQGHYMRYVVSANTYVYDKIPTNGTAGVTALGTLNFGTQVTCVGEYGGYTQIIFNNNTYGYVSTAVLSASLTGGVGTGNTGTAVVPTNPAHGTARVNTNAYVYGSQGYGVLGTVKAGTTVITTGVSGSYTQILFGTNMDQSGYIETSQLTILTTGSSTSGTTANQGYVTVKKGALIYNMSTYAQEVVPADTLVILVSQDSTGSAVIKDANGVQYKVHTSYLSTVSGTGVGTSTYVTIKAGAVVLNTSNYTYETVASDISVQLISRDVANGTVTVKDALGVTYVVSSAYVA